MVVTATWKRGGETGTAVADRGGRVAARRKASPLERRLLRLVNAAKAGEPGALGELLDAARGYLLTVASRRLPADVRPHLAPSDVVQETAIEAQAGFAGFEGESAAQFLGWLRTILLHNVGDAIRRRRAYERAIDRHASVPRPGAHRDLDTARRTPTTAPKPTEASAIRREDAGLVARVLGSLGEDARQVVRLRYWDGLSFPEIGRRLGRSDEAVRKVWYRAVARLQDALAHGDG